MLSNLLLSIGASSNFEKYRLQFTKKNDMELPNEYALAKMMETFQGKDTETRAQIGYATIIRKIETSDSNDSWPYMLKNLMILDCALERKCFVEELCEISLPAMNNFKDQNQKYAQFYFDGLLKKYLELIRTRAKCLSRRRSLYTIDRYQRQEFLQQMALDECIWHLEISESLFECIFDVLEYKKYDVQQFKLVQWLFLQLLYKLVNVYSTELLAVSRTLVFLPDASEKFIVEFKRQVLKFNSNANSIIMFANEFKWIKGFETINYQEFDPSKNEILSYVQEALRHKKNEDDELRVKVQQIHAEEKITVNRKPREESQRDSEKPLCRLNFAEEKKPKKQTFASYMNFYSEDWPPKDIITVDLIEILKQEQNDQLISADDIPLDRQTMLSMYDHRDTESASASTEYHELPVSNHPFTNIYSELASEWAGSC